MLIDLIREVLSYKGRASRLHFWGVLLPCPIVLGLIAGVESVLWGIPIVAGLLAIPSLLLCLSLLIKRLHDTGRSGFWALLVLIMLVPFIVDWIAGIILFIFIVQKSEPGTNKYGPNPHGSRHSSSDKSYTYDRTRSENKTRQVSLCGSCGKRLPQGANFCTSCGTAQHDENAL